MLGVIFMDAFAAVNGRQSGSTGISATKQALAAASPVHHLACGKRLTALSNDYSQFLK
jgi:hypothetical protein